MSGTALLLAFASLAGCASGGGEAPETAPRTVKVFLVRHGESWKNVAHPETMTEEGLDALTPKGREQAQAAGNLIARAWPGQIKIVSSPLHRAVETAELVRDAHATYDFVGAAPDALAPLQEGRAPDGTTTTFAWRVAQWRAGNDPRPEGGESLADGQLRASRCVEELVRDAKAGQAIVIVTHADVIAALLAKATGTPPSRCWPLHEVQIGSVSEFVVEPSGNWRPVSQGRVELTK